MNPLPPASAVPALHPLLELMTDAVIVLDGAGRVSFANGAALRQLGCEAGWRAEQLAPLLGSAALAWLRALRASADDAAPPCPVSLPDGRVGQLGGCRVDGGHWVVRLATEALGVPARVPAQAVRSDVPVATGDALRLAWESPFPATLQAVDFTLLDVNPAFAEFTGYARDALIGTDPIELQPEEDRGAQADLRARLSADFDRADVARVIERRLIDASGRERWLREARHALQDGQGRTLYLATMQDSTAEHVARERADRSARELDDWFNLSPVGMVLFDDSGLLVRTNRAFDGLVGVVPVLLSEAPASLQQLLAFSEGRPLAQLQPGASTLESQAWLPQPGGAPRRLRAVVRCYETPGGQRRYMAVVEDRSMEEERDLAQIQIGAMMDTAGVGLATFQESTGWLRQGRGGAASDDGAPPSAALQAIGRDIVVPESMAEFEKVQHALRRALRTEARYAIRHPVLGLRWLLTRVEPAILASGKRTTSVVTLDITEQHKSQQRNEELLHELTTILESTSTGIAYVRGGALLRCNERFERMVGLAPGGAAGRGIREIFADRLQASQIVERMLAALDEGLLFETEFPIEDGARASAAGDLWYSLSVRRTSKPDETVEAIAVLSDITRLKAQQRELEALARDRALMFSLSEVGIVFLREGKVQRANEAFCTLAGYPADDVADLSLEALFADRGEYERLWARADEQLRRRARWSGERQLRRRDGQLLWVQVSKKLVVEDDPTGGIIASYVNVDARHRAEQAVTQHAERWRAVLDSVLVGIVTVSGRGIEWMNRSARRMFGGDLADFMHQPISTVATPEADHPFRQTSYLEELFEGQAETFECRVKARDGREFWIVGNVVATGIERGGRQLTYALLDIERRRQAEARSEESQASLQRVIEMAPLAIALHDARTLRVLQLNQTAADLAGLPAAGLVGRAPDEMHPQALADAMRADMQAALAAATVTKREYSIGAHGQERLWDARYLPLGASGEAPDQLLLVATDVTEQRAAQEARLAAAIAQREMLVKEVHHRIKNNLQGVAGLLQQIAARRPEVQSVISEVVGQVQAIAQVYGLQVGAAGPLRLTSVVEAITNSVQRTFGRTIALEVEEPDAAAAWGLPEAESIPIALTINELLTNAIKHSRGSFDDVRCTLACEAQGVRVVISNPGLLGPDFKLAHIPGGVSGLGLVRALMPRRSATLAIEQQGPRVVATVALVPPGVLQLEPAASEGEGARSATIAV